MTEKKRYSVAYQGEPGCYSEQAAYRFFGEDIECVPSAGFGDVFDALSTKRATRAVLPIENVLAGTIHSNLDRIVGASNVHIVGEVEVDVKHCLLGTDKDMKVEVARSHEMALLQCDDYLKKHGIRAEIAGDTAGAARELATSRTPGVTAIASVGAAKRYGLEILAQGIGNSPINYTRFWVLSCDDTIPIPRGPKCKTSISFTLGLGPGKLVQALSAFAYHDIDLTKIESRHITSLGNAFDCKAHKDARWGYIFYVDIVGSVADKRVELAIESLKTKTAFYRLLGSYEAFSDARSEEPNPVIHQTNGFSVPVVNGITESSP